MFTLILSSLEAWLVWVPSIPSGGTLLHPLTVECRFVWEPGFVDDPSLYNGEGECLRHPFHSCWWNTAAPRDGGVQICMLTAFSLLYNGDWSSFDVPPFLLVEHCCTHWLWGAVISAEELFWEPLDYFTNWWYVSILTSASFSLFLFMLTSSSVFFLVFLSIFLIFLYS